MNCDAEAEVFVLFVRPSGKLNGTVFAVRTSSPKKDLPEGIRRARTTSVTLSFYTGTGGSSVCFCSVARFTQTLTHSNILSLKGQFYYI